MILRRIQLGRSKIGRSCHDFSHEQWTHHFLNRSSQGTYQGSSVAYMARGTSNMGRSVQGLGQYFEKLR